MIDESLLPIGSCVKIANNPKMIMIAGYLPYDNQIIYDYIGVYSPIGIRKTKQVICLNKDYIFFENSDIEKIVFIGHLDDKSDFYREYLFNIKSKMEKKNLDENLSDEEMKKIFMDSLPDIKKYKSEVKTNE